MRYNLSYFLFFRRFSLVQLVASCRLSGNLSIDSKRSFLTPKIL